MQTTLHCSYYSHRQITVT